MSSQHSLSALLFQSLWSAASNVFILRVWIVTQIFMYRVGYISPYIQIPEMKIFIQKSYSRLCIQNTNEWDGHIIKRRNINTILFFFLSCFCYCGCFVEFGFIRVFFSALYRSPKYSIWIINGYFSTKPMEHNLWRIRYIFFCSPHFICVYMRFSRIQ